LKQHKYVDQVDTLVVRQQIQEYTGILIFAVQTKLHMTWRLWRIKAP